MKKMLSKVILVGMVGALISGCKTETPVPVTDPPAEVIADENLTSTDQEPVQENEPYTISEAFVDAVKESGMLVTMTDMYDDYISITATSPDFHVQGWGISDETGEMVYHDRTDSAGFGEPGELAITGYTATLTSFAGTAMYDGIVHDEEVIDMYHELGSDEDKDIFECPIENKEGYFYKVVNTEDGIYTEDTSDGAYNISYTIVKDCTVITISGSYECKQEIEELVAKIRNTDAVPDPIIGTAAYTEAEG